MTSLNAFILPFTTDDDERMRDMLFKELADIESLNSDSGKLIQIFCSVLYI